MKTSRHPAARGRTVVVSGDDETSDLVSTGIESSALDDQEKLNLFVDLGGGEDRSGLISLKALIKIAVTFGIDAPSELQQDEYLDFDRFSYLVDDGDKLLKMAKQANAGILKRRNSLRQNLHLLTSRPSRFNINDAVPLSARNNRGLTGLGFSSSLRQTDAITPRNNLLNSNNSFNMSSMMGASMRIPASGRGAEMMPPSLGAVGVGAGGLGIPPVVPIISTDPSPLMSARSSFSLSDGTMLIPDTPTSEEDVEAPLRNMNDDERRAWLSPYYPYRHVDVMRVPTPKQIGLSPELEKLRDLSVQHHIGRLQKGKQKLVRQLPPLKKELPSPPPKIVKQSPDKSEMGSSSRPAPMLTRKDFSGTGSVSFGSASMKQSSLRMLTQDIFRESGVFHYI